MTQLTRPETPGAVTVRHESERVVVVLDGELDISLREQMTAAHEAAVTARKPIDIEARTLTFADSSAMAFLAMLVARSGQPVRILDAQVAVRAVLDLLDMGEILEIVDTQPGQREA